MMSLTCVVFWVSLSVYPVPVEDLTEAIQQRLVFKGELASFSAAERAAYLRRLDLPATLATVRREGVQAASKQAFDQVLGGLSVELRYDDIELNRLTVQKNYLDAVLLLEQSRLIPPRSEAERKAIAAAAASLLDQTEASGLEQLGPLVGETTIQAQWAQLRQRVQRDLVNERISALKMPLDVRRLKGLVDAFGQRLQDTRELARARLEDVARTFSRLPGDESAGVRGAEMAAADARFEQIVDAEKKRVVEQVARFLIDQLYTATSPPELLALNARPERIAPGYDEVCRRYSERANWVLQQRRGDWFEESKRRMDRRVLPLLAKAGLQGQINQAVAEIADANTAGPPPAQTDTAPPPPDDNQGALQPVPSVVPTVGDANRSDGRHRWLVTGLVLFALAAASLGIGLWVSRRPS